MNSIEKLRVEALEEILGILELSLSSEDIEYISKEFGCHIDMEREMDCMRYIGGNTINSELEQLKNKVKGLENELSIYYNHIIAPYGRNTPTVHVDKKNSKLIII